MRKIATDPPLSTEKFDSIQYTEPSSFRPLTKNKNIEILHSIFRKSHKENSKLSIIHFEEADNENVANKNSPSIPLEPTFFREFLSQERSIYLNLENFENHENKFSDALSRRDLMKKKRSVTFAEFPNGTQKKPNLHLQKCSQESEIMKFIILRKKSFFQKMLFFSKKFLTCHLISGLFSLLFIAIQNKYSKYCYLPPNCICNDDFEVKIFTSVKEYFTYWIIYILAIIQALFLKDLFLERTILCKTLFFFISIICSSL